jgi:glycosyltransferase involved in cell wall biosynthesis
LIVGDGPERSALEALADKLGIARQVSFAGYQTQSKVHAYLSGARAMIIPSLFYECFPRTLVEAMSAGRPIIASNVNSLNELVTGDFGVQFAAGNIDELAKSIRRLYDDKALADRLGAASRSNYLARYTPERNFDALMQIYEVAMSRQEAWLGAEPVAVGGAG